MKQLISEQASFISLFKNDLIAIITVIHAWIQKILTTFLKHQHISQRAVQTSLKKQIDPIRVSIASRGESVPEFLRKPIATCEFQGGGEGEAV